MKGHTLDGFKIHTGETVYLAELVDVPQALMRVADLENPGQTKDIPQPPRRTWKPCKHLILLGEEPEKCWRRYTDCHTYCESLNRSTK